MGGYGLVMGGYGWVIWVGYAGLALKGYLRGSATEAQFGSKGVIQNYPQLQK